MNPETVTVTFADVNYTIRYKWYMSNFYIVALDPIPAQHVYNIIKTKAMDKAIEAEYDAWVADHALDQLPDDDDINDVVLFTHNKGLQYGLDKH